MPLIEDVSAPGLAVAIKKRRKPPYGFQPTPGRPVVKLGRRPTDVEMRLLSLADIPGRLDGFVATLTNTLRFMRQNALATASGTTDLMDLSGAVGDAVRATAHAAARYGAFEVRQERTRRGLHLHLRDESSSGFDLAGHHAARVMEPTLVELGEAATSNWMQAVRLAEQRLRRAKPATATPDEWRELADRALETGLGPLARSIVNRAFAVGRGFELARKPAEWDDTEDDLPAGRSYVPDRDDVVETRSRRRGAEWDDTEDQERRRDYLPTKDSAFEPASAVEDEGEGTYLMFTSVLDKNTCFWEGTLVGTPNGPCAVEHLQAGDIIITGRGRAVPLAALRVLPGKPSVALRVCDRWLRVTSDHPVLIERQGHSAWVFAGNIRAGDVVLSDESTQGRGEMAVSDLLFRQASDAETPAHRTKGLAPISQLYPLFGVPVLTVNIDQKRQCRQVEVPRVTSDLKLLNKSNADTLQRGARTGFDAGLADVTPVARDGAELRVRAGRVPLLSTADSARHRVDRSAAEFRAKPTLRSRHERLATPATPTLLGDALLALAGADGVAVGIRRRNREDLAACGACLRDAITPTGHRAVRTPLSAGMREFDAASLAHERLKFSAGPPSDANATSAQRPFASRKAKSAAGAHAHGEEYIKELWKHRTVTAVVPLAAPPVVFDVVLPVDHTLFADGILVHNCDDCEEADGTVVEAGSDEADIMATPYYKCAGNDQCRCMLVEIDETDLTAHHAQLISLRGR
jgi:hypothetical protein